MAIFRVIFYCIGRFVPVPFVKCVLLNSLQFYSYLNWLIITVPTAGFLYIFFAKTNYNVAANKGRFCNNSKIDKLISKRLYVENKAKLFQLETQNTCSIVYLKFPVERVLLCSLQIIHLKNQCLFAIVSKSTLVSWESFALFSTDNPFEISLSILLLLQNLPLLVERVSLCSLEIIALKLVCEFCYCYKTCPC